VEDQRKNNSPVTFVANAGAAPWRRTSLQPWEETTKPGGRPHARSLQKEEELYPAFHTLYMNTSISKYISEVEQAWYVTTIARNKIQRGLQLNSTGFGEASLQTKIILPFIEVKKELYPSGLFVLYTGTNQHQCWSHKWEAEQTHPDQSRQEYRLSFQPILTIAKFK
jgi:hypothetical protein